MECFIELRDFIKAKTLFFSFDGLSKNLTSKNYSFLAVIEKICKKKCFNVAFITNHQ